MIVHRLIAISALFAGLSQVAGMIVWVRTDDVGLYEFDLSALQSADHNPNGYLLPLVGTSVSMALLLVAGMLLRRRTGTGGALLMVSMILFLGNNVVSHLRPDLWGWHAALARISFMVLIIAQIAVMRSARWHTGLMAALTSMILASLLYVLPFWFDIDLASRLLQVDMRTFIGLAESAYLAVFFGTMLRASATRSPQRQGRGR